MRCINCSFNNVAKGIRLLDKTFCLYRKIFMQVRAFERYIPLSDILGETERKLSDEQSASLKGELSYTEIANAL